VEHSLKKGKVIEDFLIGSCYKVFRHLFLLLAVFIIVVDMYMAEPGEEEIGWSMLLICILNVIPAYVNVYLLVPELLLKNRFFSYILAVAGTVVLIIITILFLQLVVNRFDLEGEVEEYGRLALDLNLLSGMLNLFLFVAGSTVVVLIQQWMRYNKRIHEIKKTTLEAEIEQLKNQINPHFLFNMLNNANVLVKENPEQAARVLLKLDDLLKYQFAGVSQEKVLLTEDIKFLEDFLNLEKIRRDNFEFIIQQEGAIEKMQVPSLLFIPFVENAVKHNNDNKRLSYVHLYFKLEKDMLSFVCINSKSQEQQARKDQPGGLGLANIRRRLELIYGNSHVLEMVENEITYTVNLQIKI